MTNEQIKRLLAAGLSTEQISDVLDIFCPETAPAPQAEPTPQADPAPQANPEPQADPAPQGASAVSMADILAEISSLKNTLQASNRANAQQPDPAEENPFASLI